MTVLRPQLRQHALQLHGVAHVALDFELAGHEGGHAVQLPRGHCLPVFPTDLDGGVGALAALADQIIGAIEENPPIVAEIQLDRLSREPGPRVLHFRRQFRLGHCRSPLAASPSRPLQPLQATPIWLPWDTKQTSSSSSTACGNRAKAAMRIPLSTPSPAAAWPKCLTPRRPTSRRLWPPRQGPGRNGARPMSRSAARSSTRRRRCCENESTISAPYSPRSRARSSPRPRPRCW